MEFEAAETWDNIAGQGWWLGPWSNWANSAPEGEERHMIISIPMIPSLVEGGKQKPDLVSKFANLLVKFSFLMHN